jgi:hypothetical protein
MLVGCGNELAVANDVDGQHFVTETLWQTCPFASLLPLLGGLRRPVGFGEQGRIHPGEEPSVCAVGSPQHGLKSFIGFAEIMEVCRQAVHAGQVVQRERVGSAVNLIPYMPGVIVEANRLSTGRAGSVVFTLIDHRQVPVGGRSQPTPGHQHHPTVVGVVLADQSQADVRQIATRPRLLGELGAEAVSRLREATAQFALAQCFFGVADPFQ